MGGTCNLCQVSIPPDELVMRTGGLVFHLRCFSCSHCHSPLLPGERYLLSNGSLFCEHEFGRLLVSPASTQQTAARITSPTPNDIHRSPSPPPLASSYTFGQQQQQQQHQRTAGASPPPYYSAPETPPPIPIPSSGNPLGNSSNTTGSGGPMAHQNVSCSTILAFVSIPRDLNVQNLGEFIKMLLYFQLVNMNTGRSAIVDSYILTQTR